MMKYREFVEKIKNSSAPKEADRVLIFQNDTSEVNILEEGKWLKASFQDEIRVDRNTHMRSGDKHAHIHDRKGNELYALTQDGKPSHGSTPFKLSKDQVKALQGQGFNIPDDGMVEALKISIDIRVLLLG